MHNYCFLVFCIGERDYFIVIHNVSSRNTGSYHCQVTNMHGVVNSAAARVMLISGTTGSQYLIPRTVPDVTHHPDIRYPPSVLAMSNQLSSMMEGSQSTPTSLDKTFERIDIPEKNIHSLPPKDSQG